MVSRLPVDSADLFTAEQIMLTINGTWGHGAKWVGHRAVKLPCLPVTAAIAVSAASWSICVSSEGVSAESCILIGSSGPQWAKCICS
ncbi:hypothetical protein LA080_001037 [Diaporthe eres]|nr:hypothetical protein LA080_001037 [Diaporthe eres]